MKLITRHTVILLLAFAAFQVLILMGLRELYAIQSVTDFLNTHDDQTIKMLVLTPWGGLMILSWLPSQWVAERFTPPTSDHASTFD